MHTSFKKLFIPVTLGALALKHRVVMPPMSRLRAEWPSGNPTAMMKTHYAQRASDGGLIIAEGTSIAAAGRPYHTAPGLWSESQVTHWKEIVDAVHARGGVIVVQLYHAGISTSLANAGLQPVSASVNPSFWQDRHIVISTIDGFVRPSPHRALATREIGELVDQFHAAAVNAKRAGFDGVEILAGQGHLVEQFLHDSSNQRTDDYGGSFENRERFLIDILQAITCIWPSNRVGVRITPSSVFNGMGDSNARALYRHLTARLNGFNLAYLNVVEPRISGSELVAEGQEPVASLELGRIFTGSIIAGGGFNPQTAELAVQDGVADAIAIGRYFTSNPDLPHRIKHDLPLTPYDRNTFYAFDAKGYTDFLTHKQLEALKEPA